MLAIAAFLFGLWAADACMFAGNGVDIPDDAVHRRLKSAGGWVGIAIPDPIDTSNNAFQSMGLLKPHPQFRRNDLTANRLIDVLLDFQSQTQKDLCFWALQPLPPPPRLENGRWGWGVEDGGLDQDIEWVKALAEVAVARLHELQLEHGSHGPIVNTMCSLGRDIERRRCANGRSDKCQDANMNDVLRYPSASVIFNISDALAEVISDWRTSHELHYPNLYWTFEAGQNPFPWNHGGPVGAPGDVDPPGMPYGPDWPTSAGVQWGYGPGIAMTAKVVPCSQIPSKYSYSKELYYCDRIEEGGQTSAIDEAYTVWKSVTSIFPATVPCKDDIVKLTQILEQIAPTILPVKDCVEAKTKLESAIYGFTCNLPGNLHVEPYTSFKQVCCSVCGGEPIPEWAAREEAPVIIM